MITFNNTVKSIFTKENPLMSNQSELAKTLTFYSMRNHLSQKTSISWSKGWSLKTGFNVLCTNVYAFLNLEKFAKKLCRLFTHLLKALKFTDGNFEIIFCSYEMIYQWIIKFYYSVYLHFKCKKSLFESLNFADKTFCIHVHVPPHRQSMKTTSNQIT